MLENYSFLMGIFPLFSTTCFISATRSNKHHYGYRTDFLQNHPVLQIRSAEILRVNLEGLRFLRFPGKIHLLE